jgi:hypothetical protein
VLSLLKNKGKTQFSIRQLDKYMQNIGNQQFNYDTFKLEYDKDPKLQQIVADFDQNSITLKTSETDDVSVKKPSGKNTVGQMAKRAVDI